MKYLQTFEQYHSKTIHESSASGGIPIVNENGMGVIVKYMGGDNGEFVVTTPNGLSKSFYADDLYQATFSEEEGERLDELSNKILKVLSMGDMEQKTEILKNAGNHDLFAGENDFMDDLETDLLFKNPDISKEELNTLRKTPEDYLSGVESMDSIPTIKSDFLDYVDDMLYYIAGKISAYNWWKNNHSSVFNGMSAQKLFAVYTRKITMALRKSGWKLSKPYDAETEDQALPGRSNIVMWKATKTDSIDNETDEMYVSAIIDPLELAKVHGKTNGELTVSLFDNNADPVEDHDEILLKDLDIVIQNYPQKLKEEVVERLSNSEYDSYLYISEGLLKDIATKVVGFFTGKNKKVKSLGKNYLNLKMREVDDTAKLEYDIQDMIGKMGSEDKARKKPEFRKKQDNLRNIKQGYHRRIDNVNKELTSIGLDNDTYRKQIEEMKDAAEKYVEERKQKKFAQYAAK